MAGVLIGSIGSGQIDHRAPAATRSSRSSARRSPPSGWSCSRAWTPAPRALYGGVAMFVMGLGLGLVMQVLVLAVQNAVDYARARRRDVRGHAVPLDGRLARHGRARRDLHRPPRRRARGLARRRRRRARSTRAASQQPPGRVRDAYTSAFTDALTTVFLVAAAIVARRLPAVLDDRGAPAAPDGRDRRRRRGVRLTLLRRLAARADERARAARRPRPHAGVHRAHRRGRRARPAARHRVAARARRGGDAARRRGPIADGRPFDAAWVHGSSASSADAGSSPAPSSPTSGRAAAERLIGARCEALHALVADWQPGRRPARERRDRPPRPRARRRAAGRGRVTAPRQLSS